MLPINFLDMHVHLKVTIQKCTDTFQMNDLKELLILVLCLTIRLSHNKIVDKLL